MPQRDHAELGVAYLREDVATCLAFRAGKDVVLADLTVRGC